MRDLTSLLTMSITDSQMNLSLPEDSSFRPQGTLAAPIQIVDLFAGPGGLGEGFASSGDGKQFEIIVSAEMDPKAWETLRLRAFYRLLKNRRPGCLDDYYNYCNGKAEKPFSKKTEDLWEISGKEAKCITLGSEAGNQTLDDILNAKLAVDRPWVLIGGPPCQAYSIVGRARNQAKADYSAENDHRHFLYKEYLRIIRERQPTIFVMENVKGILSSKVGGERIFSQILQDLSDPHRALGKESSGRKYRIYSLVSDTSFGPDDDVELVDPRAFIIRAEEHGIPQARHRVILVGIATDSTPECMKSLKLSRKKRVTVGQVINDLPALRSRLTKKADTNDSWRAEVFSQLEFIRKEIDPLDTNMWKLVCSLWASFVDTAPEKPGAIRFDRPLDKSDGKTGSSSLDRWYRDPKLDYWLNHDARGHMPSDLRRYLFAAVYAKVHDNSPKGHKQFSLEGLAPAHKNWETGKFSDRFRVQLENMPATTITSHISKDGHYFIHYDPKQCRSLTVREAARIQTFPDNYFFEGNRTQQFHQVGNAVPPLLASKIASVVYEAIQLGNTKKEFQLEPVLEEIN
ncbi:DNA cytosine methyltransferase [Pseudomonas serbica]